MAADSHVDFLEVLCDEVALWCTTPEAGTAVVVDMACQGLVQGLDGDALRAVARTSIGNEDWSFDDSVAAMLEELGRTFPGRWTPLAQSGAVRAMSRRMLASGLSPRELARWAHRVVGHSGVAEAQRLVELDDAYDCLGSSSDTAEDLDRAVTDAAQHLVG